MSEGSQPDQMAGNPEQFTEHDPDNLSTIRNLDTKHGLKRQQVSQVILYAGEVIDAVGIGNVLIPVLALGNFFGTTMVVTEIDIDVFDLLAIEFGNQTQNPVSTRMMRPKVEYHGVVVDALHLRTGKEAFCIPRHHLHGCFRGKRRHLRSATDVILA